MEQELGDNVTLQEIEVVSTKNITKVKCPMIFKRYLFCDVFEWLSNYLTFFHFGRNVIEWLYMLRTSTAGGRVTSKYPIHDSGVTSLN